MLRGAGRFGATDSLVVMPRLVNHAWRSVVAVVGLMPGAGGSCQDQDDRQRDERLRAKSQRATQPF